MDIPYLVWGLIALAMATGLLAGVFLTFSDFVMESLLASKASAGTEAMQIINRKVYHSLCIRIHGRGHLNRSDCGGGSLFHWGLCRLNGGQHPHEPYP